MRSLEQEQPKTQQTKPIITYLPIFSRETIRIKDVYTNFTINLGTDRAKVLQEAAEMNRKESNRLRRKETRLQAAFREEKELYDKQYVDPRDGLNPFYADQGGLFGQPA